MSKIFAIDPAQIIDYVPKVDRDLPEEEQTVFQLRAMNAKAAASMEDKSVDAFTERGTDKNTMRIYSGSTVLRALEKGLVGWKNFRLAANSPELEFKSDSKGCPQPEMLDRIPSEIRRELAEVITTGKGMSEQEVKNSD